MRDSERIIRDLVLGHFQLTVHARIRMNERQISVADIISCGKTGAIHSADDGKYKVIGTDLDGEKLAVICVWDGDTLIITVY